MLNPFHFRLGARKNIGQRALASNPFGGPPPTQLEAGKSIAAQDHGLQARKAALRGVFTRHRPLAGKTFLEAPMIKLLIKSSVSIVFMVFRIFVLDASASPAHGHGMQDAEKTCVAQVPTAATSSL